MTEQISNHAKDSCEPGNRSEKNGYAQLTADVFKLVARYCSKPRAQRKAANAIVSLLNDANAGDASFADLINEAARCGLKASAAKRPQYAKLVSELSEDELSERRTKEREKKARWRASRPK